MKQSFCDFLTERLSAFQLGDLWEATKDMRLPAPVYRADQVDVYPTQKKYVEWLKGCYAELRQSGWTHTDLDVQQVDVDPKGGVRALVRWTSRKAGGDIINVCDIAYFCEYTIGDGWKISMTEIIGKWVPGAEGAPQTIAS